MKLIRRFGLALTIALTCWLPALQASAACAIVQSGFNSLAGNATTTVTLTGVTSGNSIITGSMIYGTPTAATASVSDGTSFTQAVRASEVPVSTEATAAALHYRHNVSSGTHAVVLTTNATAGNRFGWFYVAEVSGLVNAVPNQTASNNAESSSPTSGTTSATTVANECVLAIMSIGQTTSDAGIDAATSGYTNLFIRQDVIAESAGSVDVKSVSATGAQSAAWGTLNGSMGWAGAIAAFEETSASPAVLSSATPSGTLGTSTVATLGATSTVTSGTFYGVVDPSGQISGITAAQVIAGTDNAGGAVTASCNGAVSTTTPSCAVSGLTAATLYSYAVAQSSAGGNSNVLTGTFTTAAAGGSVVISPLGGGGGSAARPVTFVEPANDDEFLLRASR